MKDIRIFSYVVRSDYGLAPNPFWDILTINVCKPKIRQTANLGDWVIGTGAKNVPKKYGGTTNYYAGKLVFAMRITNIMSMESYDDYCNKQLIEKIPNPNTNDWRKKVGDCIYNYKIKIGSKPGLRKGMHSEIFKKNDLSGKNTLLSEEFYYFGNKVIEFPKEFSNIAKQGRGHKIITNHNQILEFINWIRENFQANKLYGQPQLKFLLEKENKRSLPNNCFD